MEIISDAVIACVLVSASFVMVCAGISLLRGSK